MKYKKYGLEGNHRVQPPTQGSLLPTLDQITLGRISKYMKPTTSLSKT